MDTPWLDKCPAMDEGELIADEVADREGDDISEELFIRALAYGLRREVDLLEHMARELLDPDGDDLVEMRLVRLARHYDQIHEVSAQAVGFILKKLVANEGVDGILIIPLPSD